MSADLDKAIDSAVREMLDVEPQANLRARVIARIQNSSQSSFFGFQLPAFSVVRFGVLVAAATLLLLAVMLARRPEPTMRPPTAARAGDVQLPAPVGSAPNVSDAALSARVATDSQQMRRSPTSTVAPPSVAEAANTTTRIEPLTAITPIEVAPIEQSNIRPESIAVRPLNPITEMQIEPLTPPDRRD